VHHAADTVSPEVGGRLRSRPRARPAPMAAEMSPIARPARLPRCPRAGPHRQWRFSRASAGLGGPIVNDVAGRRPSTRRARPAVDAQQVTIGQPVAARGCRAARSVIDGRADDCRKRHRGKTRGWYPRNGDLAPAAASTDRANLIQGRPDGSPAAPASARTAARACANDPHGRADPPMVTLLSVDCGAVARRVDGPTPRRRSRSVRRARPMPG